MRRCVAVAMLLVAMTSAEPVDAQDGAPEEGEAAAVCWRGQPLGYCRHFVVVEMQGQLVVSSTSRTRTIQDLDQAEERAFDPGIEWNLGLMRNVSDDWALGGTASFGTGSTGVLTGLRGRARHWLGPGASVEVEAGARASAMGERWGSGTLWGPSVGTRLNAGDHGSLFLRWDGVDAPAGTDRFARVEGGFHHALYAGVSLGHTWALVGTAALGGLALWIASALGDF